MSDVSVRSVPKVRVCFHDFFDPDTRSPPGTDDDGDDDGGDDDGGGSSDDDAKSLSSSSIPSERTFSDTSGISATEPEPLFEGVLVLASVLTLGV